VGKPKYWGAEGGKVINAWAFLNYWGARAMAAPPQVYAYNKQRLVSYFIFTQAARIQQAWLSHMKISIAFQHKRNKVKAFMSSL